VGIAGQGKRVEGVGIVSEGAPRGEKARVEGRRKVFSSFGLEGGGLSLKTRGSELGGR